ncbi:MAG TPA: protein-glutamate O-methyltransferase [Rectinemataceae bacterium]|nr:protein-glutamate O-methyltransferase [Rectinemataceae bacterium]
MMPDPGWGGSFSGTAQGLSDGEFHKLASFIEAELGIRMPDNKRVMLESRLLKRIRQLELPDFSSYIDFVFSEEGKSIELINMIDAVTTNKTDFFREAEHFDFILERILPEIYSEGPAIRRRFWSAGCSTGEEPYTLAMVLEEFGARVPEFSWSIFASDLSTKVLDKAVEGVYSSEQAAPIPLSFKKKYLLRSKDPHNGLVRVRPELRAKVEFARINFMDRAWPVEGSFDVILCRNVIIYFERKTQEDIIARLLQKIRPKGFLILGHSESVAGMDLPMRSIAPTVYRKVG